MKTSKYGIDLIRLTEKDIELVRKWRNSPQIQQFMEYREEITTEMQKSWFDSINNINNFYFIIHFEGQKIGLINTSNIDWDKISSDGGIFLWEEKYYETFVPVWASLIELETTFLVFNATKSYIKTLKDNPRAIGLNRHLGYELMDGQEEAYNQQYQLTRDNFIKKSKKIRKAAAMLADQDKQELVIFYDKSEIESGFASFMESKMDLGKLRTTEQADEGIYYYFSI